MVGPIGVDHADLGDGGVAILIAEVLLAEGDVRFVHGKAAIGDKGGKAGLVELAEAVEHLDGLGSGVSMYSVSGRSSEAMRASTGFTT